MIKSLFRTEMNGTPVGKGVLRFSLLFLMPIWIVGGIWTLSHTGRLSSQVATTAIVFYALLGIFSSVVWIFATFKTGIRLLKIKSKLQSLVVPSLKNPDENLEESDDPITHVVLLTCYQEPLKLIRDTLASLASQTDAKRIRVAVGFEERSPDLDFKRNSLIDLFSSEFLKFEVTVHPLGVAGEIQGKCSNVNFCLREVVKIWKLDCSDLAKSVILTTCDSDNIFHKEHFRQLRIQFQENKNRNQVVWQAPLFYDWNLEKSSFFTRNTGHTRTLFICGFLTPLSLNSMSIQSLSLDLCMKGNYFHPAYQMEDILNTVRWMTETQLPIQICASSLPVLSGPTSGKNMIDEAKEWAAQARRWTIGSAEVFHYFLARASSIPIKVSARWGALFFFYYAFLIPVAPLLPIAWISMGNFGLTEPLSGTFEIVASYAKGAIFISSILQAFCMFVLHLLRAFWANLLPFQEKIILLRRICDLVLYPVCLIGYGAVALWSIHVLAIKGRSVCGHIASKKDNLARVNECRLNLLTLQKT